jgi:hypothetical protein
VAGGGGSGGSSIAQPAVGLRAAVRLAAAATASAITTRVHSCVLAGLIDAEAEMLVLDRITGKKMRLFAPFYTKNDHFTKTGSGQT